MYADFRILIGKVSVFFRLWILHLVHMCSSVDRGDANPPACDHLEKSGSVLGLGPKWEKLLSHDM